MVSLEFFLFNTKQEIDFDQVVANINPQSVYGKQVQKNLRPFCPGQEIQLSKEFETVKQVAKGLNQQESSQLAEIKTRFKQLPDIFQVIEFLQSGLLLNDIMLFNIKKFMVLVTVIRNLITSCQIFDSKICQQLDLPKELSEKMMIQNLKYSFSLGDYASEELQQIQQQLKAIRLQLRKVQDQEKNKIWQHLPQKYTGLWNDDRILISKFDAKAIELIENIPNLTKEIESFASVTFKRLPVPEERKLIEEMAELEKREREAELAVRKDLTFFLKRYVKNFLQLTKLLGWMDWVIAKAVFAINFNATYPLVNESPDISILNGYHISIEKELKVQGRQFTPVSINLKRGVAVITGANMGGKTVTLKTIGLLVALAQHGIPVPASRMMFCMVDFMCLSGGDNWRVGLSSFGAEVELFKVLLEHQDKRGLVLLDEPARGTNPAEGSALVSAMVDRFTGGLSLVVVATHFNGLTRIAGVVHWQVRGLKSVKNLKKPEDISQYFDFRVERVEASTPVPKDALKVAALLGLDNDIIAKAKRILERTGKGGENL